MKLNFKEYGDPSNPTLVILHGLFGTLDNWHNIAKSLSDSIYVVSMDLRNHGNSDHEEDMSYALMADDVRETLSSMHINSTSMLGHSMGGKVVMCFADRHPEVLEKMIVVDIAPRKYPPGHEEIFKAMFGLDLSAYDSRNKISNDLAKDIPEESVRLFLLKNIERRKEGGYQWRLNLQSIYDHYSEITSYTAPEWPFGNPTLFIRGSESKYISHSDEAEIGNLFPSAEIETIEGAGHWVHADKPTELLEVLRNFLQN